MLPSTTDSQSPPQLGASEEKKPVSVQPITIFDYKTSTFDYEAWKLHRKQKWWKSSRGQAFSSWNSFMQDEGSMLNCPYSCSSTLCHVASFTDANELDPRIVMYWESERIPDLDGTYVVMLPRDQQSSSIVLSKASAVLSRYVWEEIDLVQQESRDKWVTHHLNALASTSAGAEGHTTMLSKTCALCNYSVANSLGDPLPWPSRVELRRFVRQNIPRPAAPAPAEGNTVKKDDNMCQCIKSKCCSADCLSCTIL